MAPERTLSGIIQDSSYGIGNFSITTDNFKAFEDTTYTSLGELEGAGRTFTIYGGSSSGRKSIDGLLSDGTTKGEGVTVGAGQTLEVSNVAEFKNFNTAIKNEGTLKILNSVFANNEINGEKGDILNNGTLTFTGGNNEIRGGIIGSGTTKTEDAQISFYDASIEQGKIEIDYDNSSMSFIAENDDITINTTDGFEYLGRGNVLNLKAKNGKKISLNSKLTGNSRGILTLEGDSEIALNKEINDMRAIDTSANKVILSANAENSTFNLLGGLLKVDNDSYIQNNSLAFDGGNLDLRNNVVSTISIANLSLKQNSNFFADVDLAAGTMDKFSVTGAFNHTGGTLNVAGLNLLTDATKRLTTINFADDNLKSHVAYTGDTRLQGLAPIYKYDIEYKPQSGNFEFRRHNSSNPYENFNPSMFGSQVASQSTYLAQLANYDIALGNIDQKLLMTQAQRTALKYGNKYASNDTNNPMVYSPLFIPEENSGLWFRPYTTFESVGLDNGPKVSNVMYGTLFGGDSDLISYKNGWDAQFSAYAGYNGSHQAYDGISVYQNGGILGGTAAFFKGNFFEAVTANVGANNAKINAKTFGSDDIAILSTGVASKTGYNFEFANGKFIVQPSWLMSYSFISPLNDYKLNGGVNIKNDNLHSIQLSPAIKFIGNFNNGWQPYASVKMVWNVLNKTKVQPAYADIPEATVKPYCEYGLGVQKTWGDRVTGFGQAMVRSGGRNGVALSVGIRIALGKLNDRHQK